MIYLSYSATHYHVASTKTSFSATAGSLVVVFPFAIIFLSLLYLLGHFSYEIDQARVAIHYQPFANPLWSGTWTISRDDIHEIVPLRYWWQLLPLVSGTVPLLLGRLRRSRMLVIKRRGWRGLFPVLITPRYPETFARDFSQTHNS